MHECMCVCTMCVYIHVYIHVYIYICTHMYSMYVCIVDLCCVLGCIDLKDMKGAFDENFQWMIVGSVCYCWQKFSIVFVSAKGKVCSLSACV